MILKPIKLLADETTTQKRETAERIEETRPLGVSVLSGQRDHLADSCLRGIQVIRQSATLFHFCNTHL